MSVMRAHPTFVAENVVVDPFEAVELTVRFDKRPLSGDLVSIVRAEVCYTDAANARGQVF